MKIYWFIVFIHFLLNIEVWLNYYALGITFSTAS